MLNILDKDNPQWSKILDLLQKVLLTRNPVQGSGSGTIGHYPEKVIHLNQSQPSQGSQTTSGYFTNTTSETTCKGSLLSKASHPAYQGLIHLGFGRGRLCLGGDDGGSQVPKYSVKKLET